MVFFAPERDVKRYARTDSRIERALDSAEWVSNGSGLGIPHVPEWVDVPKPVLVEAN